jgi:hypothetical protein
MEEREPKKERKTDLAIPPAPLRLPDKTEIDEDSDSGIIRHPVVEFGAGRRWCQRQVYPDTTEEQLNEIASSIFGQPRAFTDCTAPHDRQQLRCYRDIAKEELKTWVDLRMCSPRAEAMIRCSTNTTAEEIEEVASELWQTDVQVQKELPQVIPSRRMTWLKEIKPPQTEEEKKIEETEDEADV